MTSGSLLEREDEAALQQPRPASLAAEAESTVAAAESALEASAPRGFEPDPTQGSGTPPSSTGGASAAFAPAAPRVFNPWIIALVVTMGTFMEVLDTSIANVALPHIAGSLSASQDESTWVLTSYLVANAIILPISGWISSVIGRKNFYMISVVLFTIFSAACGIAPTLATLVIFRVLQGLAGGGLQPSVQAILADAFPGEKRGMAMAVYTVAILCAPVLGPTLGGWITDNYSWRWIFYINIPVGVLCAIFTRIVLQDPAKLTAQRLANKGKKLRIDGTGLALISIGLAMLEVVLDKGQELDWFGNTYICWAAGIAITSLVCAVFWELRVKNPVVNLRLLTERNFATCCIMILGLYTSLYACTFLAPQYMQSLMGYDATTAGLTVSPAGLVTMLEVPLVGWALSKGLDARRLIVVGISFMAAGTWWYSVQNLDVSEGQMMLPRVLQILGLGLTTVPISTIMFRFLPADQSSNAAGLYALVRNEGGSIGIAIASTFLQRTQQAHQSYLGAHLDASNPMVQQAMHAVGNGQGVGAAHDAAFLSMAQLYHQLGRQAELLAYMDQYRLFTYILVCLIPLILFLKKPPRVVGKIELDAH